MTAPSLLFLLLISQVEATIIRVPQDHASIQAGIDATTEGDTVLVDTGRYVENIKFNGKNLVLGSWFLVLRDTSYISRTVIDGDSSGSVVTFESGEDSTALLSGFTITGGLSSSGGGISIVGASPTLRNLRIVGNLASGGMGGGLYCSRSNASIENCLISKNSSGPNEVDAGGAGGGLACEYSNPVLRNVTISNNTSLVYGRGFGGGIALFNSDPVLEHALIFGNIATGVAGGWGGGIALHNSNPVCINVTIAYNASENSTYTDGVYIQSGHVFLINSIVWDDSISSDCDLGLGSQSITVAYSDLDGGRNNIQFLDIGNCTVYWDENNIGAYPLFADPENGDFRLREESPCIDAGTALFVWEGDTLVNLSPGQYEGAAPDMGAFESLHFDAIREERSLPRQFVLHQNYPNPFNPTTTIEFSMPTSGVVKLTVHDLLGREVSTLVNRWHEAGRHSVQWNASDVSSGIYFVKMTSGDFSQVRKVMVLR